MVELRGAIHAFQAHDAEPSLHSVVRLKETTPGVAEAYGLAFHPRFEENHQVFVCYVMGGGAEDGTRLSRFKVDLSDSPRLLMESEEILLTWKGGGHNGGCLRFGPDGMLYISTGDGSGPVPLTGLQPGRIFRIYWLRFSGLMWTRSRPLWLMVSLQTILLSIQRALDLKFGPLVFSKPLQDEFESRSGDLWVGDVGWELWELVTRVRKGGNYGWSIREGSHPIQPNAVEGTPVTSWTHWSTPSFRGCLYYRWLSLSRFAHS